MNVAELLADDRDEILDEAEAAIRRSGLKHYAADGAGRTRERLERLYELATQAIATRRISGLIRYAERIAAERFAAGFGLFEVQTAFNVVEEAIWRRVLERIPADHLAEALGIVSTVLGLGKDALARRYVSLASRSEVPSLDLSAMFRGTEAVE
jgi:hypothetical protein